MRGWRFRFLANKGRIFSLMKPVRIHKPWLKIIPPKLPLQIRLWILVFCVAALGCKPHTWITVTLEEIFNSSSFLLLILNFYNWGIIFLCLGALLPWTQHCQWRIGSCLSPLGLSKKETLENKWYHDCHLLSAPICSFVFSVEKVSKHLPNGWISFSPFCRSSALEDLMQTERGIWQTF